MKRRETIFDFGTQVLVIFGFSILCLNIFCMLFGESARSFSTLFELGTVGLTKGTMLQFFLMSVIIVVLKFLFFTDMLIRDVSVKLRTAGMFCAVILVLALFIFLFGWFPVDMWIPWVLFFVCFGGSAAVSTALSILKERAENKEMAEALERLKSVKLENCGRETVIPVRHKGSGGQGGNGAPGARGELRMSALPSGRKGTGKPVFMERVGETEKPEKMGSAESAGGAGRLEEHEPAASAEVLAEPEAIKEVIEAEEKQPEETKEPGKTGEEFAAAETEGSEAPEDTERAEALEIEQEEPKEEEKEESKEEEQEEPREEEKEEPKEEEQEEPREEKKEESRQEEQEEPKEEEKEEPREKEETQGCGELKTEEESGELKSSEGGNAEGEKAEGGRPESEKLEGTGQRVEGRRKKKNRKKRNRSEEVQRKEAPKLEGQNTTEEEASEPIEKKDLEEETAEEEAPKLEEQKADETEAPQDGKGNQICPNV